MTSLTFGDVVSYEGKHLVYLSATDDTIYFANMPDLNGSLQFIQRRDVVYRSTPRSHQAARIDLYCFIELTTEDFKNRIAHYGLRREVSDYSLEDFMDKIGSLNTDDKKTLKTEIVEDGTVSKELRELVGSIDV